MRFEPVVLQRKPDIGSCLWRCELYDGCRPVGAKLGIKVAHVEAGLRSNDRGMPEEINRLITDRLSDVLFTPSADANENLLREGTDAGRIHLVGNVMIDTLVRLLPLSASHRPNDTPKRYALVTLHRPSNVDDLPWLRELLLALSDISHQVPVIFPVHPRTQKNIADLGLTTLSNGHLRLLDPMPYLTFLALQRMLPL